MFIALRLCIFYSLPRPIPATAPHAFSLGLFVDSVSGRSLPVNFHRVSFLYLFLLESRA